MKFTQTTAPLNDCPKKSFKLTRLALYVGGIFTLAACGGSNEATTPANTNAAPVAQTSGDITVRAGKTTQLDASLSTDSNGDKLSYTWTQVSGHTVELTDANTAKPSFIAPNLAGDIVFNVAVSDGKLSSAQSPVTITILPTPALNVNASGSKTVAHNKTATLEGSVSNVSSNEGLTFKWTQTGGVLVELSNADTATASFNTGNKSGFAFFNVDVSSNNGGTGSKQIAVEITNTPPIAMAELNGTATAGQKVQLSAGNSKDADGDSLSYTWKQVAGEAVEITNAGSATASFVAPNSATFLAFEVQVNDGEFNSHPATLLVTINASEAVSSTTTETPVAEATPAETVVEAPAAETTPAAETVIEAPVAEATPTPETVVSNPQ